MRGVPTETTAVEDGDHLHMRPQWTCRRCGKAWPCPSAKASLLTEYRAFPSLLKIYLSAQMYDALEDLMAEGTAPDDLHERFLGWTGKGEPRA